MKFKIGQKFIDKWGNELELVEIVPTEPDPYVLSYWLYDRYVVEPYYEDELSEMQLI